MHSVLLRHTSRHQSIFAPRWKECHHHAGALEDDLAQQVSCPSHLQWHLQHYIQESRFRHCRVDNDDGYFALYRLITNQPEIVPAPLGKRRELPSATTNKISPILFIPPTYKISAKLFLTTPFSRPIFHQQDKRSENELHTDCKKTTAITQPQAVHGLGGVGKTRNWQFNMHVISKPIMILRLRVSTKASPSELHANLANLADVLKLPEAYAKEQEVKVLATLDWLRLPLLAAHPPIMPTPRKHQTEFRKFCKQNYKVTSLSHHGCRTGR